MTGPFECGCLGYATRRGKMTWCTNNRFIWADLDGDWFPKHMAILFPVEDAKLLADLLDRATDEGDCEDGGYFVTFDDCDGFWIVKGDRQAGMDLLDLEPLVGWLRAVAEEGGA